MQKTIEIVLFDDIINLIKWVKNAYFVNPFYYVFYDKLKQGLEYYKKINSDILVAIRVNDGRELKVKSIYPVEKEKIENRKKKEEQMFL